MTTPGTMTLSELHALIADSKGEWEHIEFKKATGELHGGMETLCAFLNGSGGQVLFGVTNLGKIHGQDMADATFQEVANAIRKLEPPAWGNTKGTQLVDSQVSSRKTLRCRQALSTSLKPSLTLPARQPQDSMGRKPASSPEEARMDPVIQTLNLNRFRSIPAETVRFDNPTFLVGENGSGKSNVYQTHGSLLVPSHQGYVSLQCGRIGALTRWKARMIEEEFKRLMFDV